MFQIKVVINRHALSLSRHMHSFRLMRNDEIGEIFQICSTKFTRNMFSIFKGSIS